MIHDQSLFMVNLPLFIVCLIKTLIHIFKIDTVIKCLERMKIKIFTRQNVYQVKKNSHNVVVLKGIKTTKRKLNSCINKREIKMN